MERPAAFFDIDGTLFRRSLVIELVEYLVEKEVFALSAYEEVRELEESWLDRKGAYNDYVNKVVEVFVHRIKGAHYGVVADAAREIAEHKRHRVYRYTRDLLQELKKGGYFLVALSHSPKLIVDLFCVHHGFDKSYGHLYEIGPQDLFTGNVIDADVTMNKANLVRRVFEKENVTKEGSYGVGDTVSDVPFLELVDTPICFNPSKELYTYAERMGWQVIVERKDVTYEI